jgi:ribosome-binding factor A
LRTVPKLLFVYDESVEQGERLASLIEQAVATDHQHDETD